VLGFSESKHGPHHRFSRVVGTRVWYQCEVRLAPRIESFLTVLSGVGIHTDFFASLRLCVRNPRERFRRISRKDAKSQRHKKVSKLGPIISEKDGCKFRRSRVD